MADVSLNPMFEGVSGKFGDLVFRQLNGATVLARLPKFEGREFTPAQKAVHEQFRLAAIYGKMVIADPIARAVYDAAVKTKGVPAFALMVRDFLIEPTVDEVDVAAYNKAAGDKIFVRASDDFEVTGVEVEIADTTGAVIESGAAVKSTSDPGRWEYTATANVPVGTSVQVKASATDRPGHKGTKTETK